MAVEADGLSIRVLNEVFDQSQARATTFCVLIALADAAAHDGVCWLPVEAEPPKRSITSRAHCSKRDALRAIRYLQDIGEIEVVKVRRKSSYVNVYRVVVGSIRDVAVDYDRLPFELPVLFGDGARLAPSTPLSFATPASKPTTETGQGQGATLAPSSGEVTVPDPDGSRCHDEPVQGDKSRRAKVTHSHAREEEQEPSEEAAAGPSLETGTAKASGISAAAEPEPPASLQVVRGVVDGLRRRDAGTVKAIEPLAAQLPESAFLQIAESVGHRCATGTVANDAGLLIKLLRIAIAERTALFHARHLEELAASGKSATTRESWLHIVARDQPAAYVRAMARSLTDHELSERLVAPFTQELRELARAVRDGEEPTAALPESPRAAKLRWIDEISPTLPLADVHQVIDGWDDVDAVERQLYTDRADAIRDADTEAAAA